MKRLITYVVAGIFAGTLISCSTIQVESMQDENQVFLEEDVQNKNEVFRVLLSSDEYLVVQKHYPKSIKRSDDTSGDNYFREEISKLDKIDEVREGVAKVWLYPDSGKIMQVRLQSTFLQEIDQIILEDIQRWSFSFPKKEIFPLKFDVKYRVVLQKKLSDEQIMKEVRDHLKEKSGQ
jgi:hypothetical protein